MADRSLLLLSSLSLLTAGMLLGACDDRECEGYNSCGEDAYCSSDGECIFDPIGVNTTRSGVVLPAPPEEFAQGTPTADLSDAMLDGDFGLLPLNREPATSASVFESDSGTDIWIEMNDETTGEWAMIAIWSSRPLDELLPAVGQPRIVIDTSDLMNADTGGVVCSTDPAQASFDEWITELTITAQQGVYSEDTWEIAAVTDSILRGYEATATFGSQPTP